MDGVGNNHGCSVIESIIGTTIVVPYGDFLGFLVLTRKRVNAQTYTTMHNFISVIIPTYNCARYLPLAIASVLNQSYKDIELIIVDDGSTDTTREIVEKIRVSGIGSPSTKLAGRPSTKLAGRPSTKLAGRRSSVLENEQHNDFQQTSPESRAPSIDIKYFYQNNQGAAAARNRGVAMAKGEYIAFCDSDDVWGREKLTKQIRVLQMRREFAMVHTDSSVIDAEGVMIKYSARRKRQDGNGKVFLDFFRSYRSLVMLSSVLLRRDCFEALGGFEEKYRTSEDYEFFLRLFWFYEVCLIDQPLVQFRVRPMSLSRKDIMRDIVLRRTIVQKFINQHQSFFNNHTFLVKEKWRTFNSEAGQALFYQKEFRLSNSYFAKALTYGVEARVLFFYCVTLFPQSALRALARVKRTIGI